jgi:hypothetical protein
MNERIRELAEKAEFSKNELHIQGDNFQRFAELIIKECTDVLNKRFVGDLNREDMEVRRCIADIKRHFGVE